MTQFGDQRVKKAQEFGREFTDVERNDRWANNGREFISRIPIDDSALSEIAFLERSERWKASQNRYNRRRGSSNPRRV